VRPAGLTPEGERLARGRSRASLRYAAGAQGRAGESLGVLHTLSGAELRRHTEPAAVTGYACACPDASAPARPAVVLDPFGGSGTTALTAAMLGRTGITVDRSADYCRLAAWRTADPAERARALGVPKPPPVIDGQGSLFDEIGTP
jgi:hypothetical protein